MMADDVQRINDLLFFDMPQVKTEAVMIFGARSVTGALARAAAPRHQDGAKFILAGGVRVFQPEVLFALAAQGPAGSFTGALRHKADFLSLGTEAEHARRVLLEEGVSPGAIICVDNESTNTGANVQKCAHALREFNSVALCTADHTGLRTLATARRYLGPDGPALTVLPVSPFGVNRHNWHETPLARYVRAEAAKMDPANPGNYYDAGYCVPVSIENEIARSQRAAGRDGSRMTIDHLGLRF